MSARGSLLRQCVGRLVRGTPVRRLVPHDIRPFRDPFVGAIQYHRRVKARYIGNL